MTLGLYVHIPFCSAICNYCNFNRGLFESDLKARYVDALVREIQQAGSAASADTIYFGGGTPSLLEASEVARIVRTCREAFDVTDDAEVTLEANPESVDPVRLTALRNAGVNRLSLASSRSGTSSSGGSLGCTMPGGHARRCVKRARRGSTTSASI